MNSVYARKMTKKAWNGGRWVIVGRYNGPRYKKGWKPLV